MKCARSGRTIKTTNRQFIREGKVWTREWYMGIEYVNHAKQPVQKMREFESDSKSAKEVLEAKNRSSCLWVPGCDEEKEITKKRGFLVNGVNLRDNGEVGPPLLVGTEPNQACNVVNYNKGYSLE